MAVDNLLGQRQRMLQSEQKMTFRGQQGLPLRNDGQIGFHASVVDKRVGVEGTQRHFLLAFRQAADERLSQHIFFSGLFFILIGFNFDLFWQFRFHVLGQSSGAVHDRCGIDTRKLLSICDINI